MTFALGFAIVYFLFGTLGAAGVARDYWRNGRRGLAAAWAVFAAFSFLALILGFT